MFKTLFSRMLATYLSVTLGLLFLLGITVGSMFQQQYIGEKESELRREAEEINETVASRYMDGNKRPVAEQELLITARKYDALIVLRFADDQFGKRAFMDETAQDKWAGSQDLDVDLRTPRFHIRNKMFKVKKSIGWRSYRLLIGIQ